MQSSVCDVFDDFDFQLTLMLCKDYCVKKDPNYYYSTQTCKVFTEKEIVLTDCEVTCAEISEGKS